MQVKLLPKPFCFFLPAIIWGAVIFVIISLPPSAVPPTDKIGIPHIDKIIHFGIFFVFGSLLVFGFFRLGHKHIKYIFFSILIGFSYGAFTEYLQYCCFTGRHGSIADFIADGFGTVFGTLFMLMVSKIDYLATKFVE